MARPLPQTLTVEFGLDEPDDMRALRRRCAQQLGIAEDVLPEIVPRKKSLDCRRARVRYHWLVELTPEPEQHRSLAQPHPIERREDGVPPVAIIGGGPCGLFVAYELARRGVPCVLLDRGKTVQPRRKDLKALNQKGIVDLDSNYCFGEGGAGTYSDGKLYTRSHKRGHVRDVIEVLALHGAPQNILTDARPHIGSNRLPEVITAMRHRLQGVGVEFRFGCRVVGIERSLRGHVEAVRLATGERIGARAVVLATGHSARDVYRFLAADGHSLESKGFAIGVRIEHPQPLINSIQYGASSGHPNLPSAAYRLVDRHETQAVFSFCMCPGGFIVPAATESDGLVVNGMSPSKRNSKYANSGIVVQVSPEAWSKAGFSGSLGGVDFQTALERQGYIAGGGALAAPATRVTDFLSGKASTTLPPTSYQPGLNPCDIAQVLDATGLPLAQRLRSALTTFGRRMKGYISEEAALIGIESRTSSPVRIARDPESLESTEWRGLYPAGEGAGYAGGIVSAAVDGIRVAQAIAGRAAAVGDA